MPNHTIAKNFTDLPKHVVLARIISNKLIKIAMCNLVIIMFCEQSAWLLSGKMPA
jgi:hypothetical protein